MIGMGHIINGSFYLLYILVSVAAMHWFNVVLGALLFVCMYKFADYFQVELMKVKLLDNVSKSPIYSEFSAAIEGLIPIRCYNQGGNFLLKFLKLVNNQGIS